MKIKNPIITGGNCYRVRKTPDGYAVFILSDQGRWEDFPGRSYPTRKAAVMSVFGQSPDAAIRKSTESIGK